MTVKVDAQKKQFESSFLKAFSALTRMSQQAALHTTRQYVEEILAMYNDGYSAMEPAQYVRGLIDVDQIKREAVVQSVAFCWR